MKNKLALLGGEKSRTKPFTVLPAIGQEERDLVNEVLSSGLLSGFIAQPGDAFLGGPKVRALEKIFCDYFEVPHAVAMNSATAGLHAALIAAGVGAGDEVIVTPYTMSASAVVILMQNAVPVFADIDPANFCLDPADIWRKITPRTKAILVVHLFGKPADMDPILKMAQEKSIFVIEDCAQAPGAVYRGKKAGTLGHIGIFSLNQHKIITTGEGGVAVTRDPELALRMQLARNHGEVVLLDMDIPDKQKHADILGWNYRITELEAAVGIGQFKRLDELTEQRIRLAEYLTKQLKAIPGLKVPETAPGERQVYFTYPLRFQAEKAGFSRDKFVEALKAEGIPCAAGYVKPIYWQPVYEKKNYPKGLCPVTERMYGEELVLLPVCRAPHTEDDMDDAARAIRKIFDFKHELKTSPVCEKTHS